MFENVTYLHANNCINKEEHSNQQDDVGQSLKYKNCLLYNQLNLGFFYLKKEHNKKCSFFKKNLIIGLLFVKNILEFKLISDISRYLK